MQFEEMKYSGEAKMSSGQRMLEEFQTHLTEGERRLVNRVRSVKDVWVIDSPLTPEDNQELNLYYIFFFLVMSFGYVWWSSTDSMFYHADTSLTNDISPSGMYNLTDYYGVGHETNPTSMTL